MVKRTSGFDENGQQIFTHQYFSTQKEANEVLALQNAGVLAKRSNITLGQVYAEWSAQHYPQLKQNSIAPYESAWLRLKVLASSPIQDIRLAHLQKIINEAETGLASKQKLKVLCTSLFKYAMTHDLVNKDYAALIKLPKEKKTEKQIFTKTERLIIESNADTIPFLDTIMILMCTGLRVGEFLALRRFNINFTEMFIKVGEAKTEAGTGRIIPIHPKIIKYMKKYFVEQDGVDFHVTYFRKLYSRALEEIGVRRLTPHACRHTAATIWAEAGVDTETIRRMMGHTKYAFTAENYTHVNIDHLHEEIQKVQ